MVKDAHLLWFSKNMKAGIMIRGAPMPRSWGKVLRWFICEPAFLVSKRVLQGACTKSASTNARKRRFL